MIETVVGEFGARKSDRGIDEARVWDGNACDDAGCVREYGNHFGSYG